MNGDREKIVIQQEQSIIVFATGTLKHHNLAKSVSLGKLPLLAQNQGWLLRVHELGPIDGPV